MLTNEETESKFAEDFESLLSAGGLEIGEAIVSLNQLFLKHYGLSSYGINCGDCEYYADRLSVLVPGCESFWGDELTSEEDDHATYGYHCIVRYKGKFYDSQHPFGVSDFREMSAFGMA